MKFIHLRPSIKVKKLFDSAIIPYRATDGAAGYDMSLCMEADEEYVSSNIYDEAFEILTFSDKIKLLNRDGYLKTDYGVYIMPGRKVHLHTGIAMEIPKEYCGLLMNRSSLSNLDQLTLCDNVGLIDSDYRGEITLHLLNESNEIKYLQNHTRICQIVITPYLSSSMVEVDKLSYTKRGYKGYGSTGNKTWDDD